MRKYYLEIKYKKRSIWIEERKAVPLNLDFDDLLNNSYSNILKIFGLGLKSNIIIDYLLIGVNRDI